MAEPTPFGKYTLLDRLASGPVADVYRAVTRKADGGELPVVVKLIRPEAARDQKFLTSFVDEARVASMLDHPNIARTYEWGKQEDSLFIAMEYIEGTNLASLMQSLVEQGLRFPPTYAVYIVSEVLIGLVHAHHLKDPYGNPMGLVHRDVSPPNIVLSSSGEVKLVDFGLAKVAAKLQATIPGVFGGKFTYMAPEQIRHSEVDHRADIFSCGVVLYELLTGQKLHSTGEDASVRAVVESARSRPPSSVHADIPAELDAVLLRAMAEDPAQRPQDAADMASQLTDFIERWDRQVDADTISSFLVDTLSGRAGQRKEQVGFAFGEATSQWMAQGENLEKLVKVPAAGGPEDLLAGVPPVPRGPVDAPPPQPTPDLGLRPPKKSFAGGETVMAIQDGGLGKGRQLKNLLLVLGVLAVAVLAVVLVITNLGKEDASTEETTEEPAPAAPKGFAGPLQVKTEPGGALVFVDGDLVEPQGSPPRIMGQRAGTHRIKLVVPGYLPWEGDVVLEADEPHTLEQTLQERRGPVTITSTPPRAWVFFDGKRVGRTPRTLEDVSAAKAHQVVLRRRRYRPEKLTIEPSDWPDDPAQALTIEKKLTRTRRRRRRR